MHEVLVWGVVLVVTAGVVTGIAGITTGWVPPIGRKKVLRPELWGYGTLTAAVGMAVFQYFGPLNGQPGAYFVVALLGMAVFVLGLLLQTLSQRPGRTP